MNQEQRYLSELAQTFTSRFDREELRTLCFHLSINYDDLPAEGRENKARELIRWLHHRNRIRELVEMGRQMRPDISWRDPPPKAEQNSFPSPGAQVEGAPAATPEAGKRVINTGGGAYFEGPVEVSGGDLVGHDKIMSGSDAIAVAKAFEELRQALAQKPDTPEKVMAAQAVQGLEEEAQKGERAEEEHVEKWLKFLLMALPDIGEVAIKTFINPIQGLSTAFQKIAQKAKESQ